MNLMMASMFLDSVLVIIKEKPCFFYNGGKYRNFFGKKQGGILSPNTNDVATTPAPFH